VAIAVKLDEDFDLDLSGGGPRLTSGVEAARGALGYSFNTQAGTSREDPGEWAYDYRYGVLWRQVVFGRYFKPDETQAHLAAVASRTTGVAPVGPYQVRLSFVDVGNSRTQQVVIDGLRPSTSSTQSSNVPDAVTISVF